MHILDGFLDPATAAVTCALMLAYTAYAPTRLREGSRERMTLAAVLAAGIFAAWTLN